MNRLVTQQTEESVSWQAQELALKRKRKELSAKLFESVSAEVIGLTPRYYKLAKKILSELEARDPAEMRTPELIQALNAVRKILEPIERTAALAPPPDRRIVIESPPTQNFFALIEKAAETRDSAYQEITKRQLKRTAKQQAMTVRPVEDRDDRPR